jgi:hypothetical protein
MLHVLANCLCCEDTEDERGHRRLAEHVAFVG